MQCPNCNENLSVNAAFCANCGTQVSDHVETQTVRSAPVNQGPSASNQFKSEANQVVSEMRRGSFSNFDKMITPVFIKVIYFILVTLIVLFGLFLMYQGMDANYGGGFFIFLGLLVMIIGPVFVRVNCELMIILFKIHETLEEIRLK